MYSFIAEILKLATFSPALQRLAAQNRTMNTKSIFNVNPPASLGGGGQVYSGGIRTNSMMPKAPSITTPKILR